MSKTFSGKDLVRAWKDADYRESLSAEDRAALPNHPAGWVDLTDSELESIHGAEQITVAGQVTTVNCVPHTATGIEHCDPMHVTFMAADPRDGCQISVNNYTCHNLPGTIVLPHAG